jgi:hypothetical protein
MAETEAIFDQPAKDPSLTALRARVGELAEALFQSIRAQLSVRKYQAIAVERGASLDTIDAPLTEDGWWRARFAEVRKLPAESDRLARLSAALVRTDPGPGGFYDNLGDPKRQPHLIHGPAWEDDPASYIGPFTDFGFRGYGPSPETPRAWWRHAEALYDGSLSLRYPSLDRTARYRVRVVYGRERRALKIRMVAGDGNEIHGYLAKPFEPLEFDVPPTTTANGSLTLTWTGEAGNGGTGRGCAVAEVWLLKTLSGK